MSFRWAPLELMGPLLGPLKPMGPLKSMGPGVIVPPAPLLGGPDEVWSLHRTQQLSQPAIKRQVKNAATADPQSCNWRKQNFQRRAFFVFTTEFALTFLAGIFARKNIVRRVSLQARRHRRGVILGPCPPK